MSMTEPVALPTIARAVRLAMENGLVSFQSTPICRRDGLCGLSAISHQPPLERSSRGSVQNRTTVVNIST